MTLAVTSDRLDEPIGVALVIVIGTSFAGTGLFAWWRRPGNPVGPLMFATGFSWFFSLYVFSDFVPLFVFGFLFTNIGYGFLIHLLLVFPDQRLETRFQRWVAFWGYAAVTAMHYVALFLIDPADNGCDGCPDNPFLIPDDQDLYEAWGALQSLVGIAVLIGLVLVLVRRWRGWSAERRRAFAPVLWTGGLSLCLIVLQLIIDLFSISDTARQAVFISSLVPLALVPFAFLVGLLRSRISDAEAAAASAAGLRVENERLDAELRIQNEELRASRARIVEAGYRERRRVERDLHDGAQQRLVSLALNLKLARGKVDSEPAEAGRLLDEATAELEQATAELRELARGIHPGLLTDRGLVPALEALASRSPVPVELKSDFAERPAGRIEAATYFVVSEALANVAKHASARQAAVTVTSHNGDLVVEVADDGRGGADPAGSGLQGLADRVAALDGRFSVSNGDSGGTVIRASIPLG